MGPVNEMDVYVNQFNVKTAKNSVVEEASSSSKSANVNEELKKMLGESNLEWIFNKDNYDPIDIDAYPGWTCMKKFQLLLANYSTNLII